MSYIFHMRPNPDGYYGFVLPVLDERRLEIEVDNWIKETEATATKLGQVKASRQSGRSFVELPAYELDESSAVLFQLMFGEQFELSSDAEARLYESLGEFKSTVCKITPVVVR